MTVTTLDLYGIAALTILGLVFLVVRQIPLYLALVALLIAGFATTAFWISPAGSLADRIVMTSGLMACGFGLLIVRVMLIRSVSLQLLGRLEGGARGDLFEEDIRGRLRDMRMFQLVRTDNGTNALTPFGQLIGGFTAACYAMLGIQR